MSKIHFGESFAVRYERLTGVGKGEQHLPTESLERMLKEFELEQQVGDRLALNVNVLSERPAKVVMTNQGSYLLTDGPRHNTVSAYDQILASQPPANTVDEFIRRDEEVTAQLNQQRLLDSAADLNLEYRVGKNAQSARVYPVLNNLNSILDVLKEKLKL